VYNPSVPILPHVCSLWGHLGRDAYASRKYGPHSSGNFCKIISAFAAHAECASPREACALHLLMTPEFTVLVCTPQMEPERSPVQPIRTTNTASSSHQNMGQVCASQITLATCPGLILAKRVGSTNYKDVLDVYSGCVWCVHKMKGC
jgi:hypothetical protein